MKPVEKDKRLFMPQDSFEEEASEGLGKLTREEAEEDLREIRGRIDRRLRKPRIVWLPAAAAVVIILLASVLYISIFRESDSGAPEIALSDGDIKDTAMIAMAEPLKRVELQSPAPVETLHLNASSKTEGNTQPQAAIAEVKAKDEAEVKVEAKDEVKVEAKDEVKVEAKDEVKVEAKDEVKVEVEEEVAEEVIVEAMPMAERAVSGVAATQSDKKSRASVVTTPNLGVATGIHQPEPVGGMEEFNSWVEKNIRYPEEVTPRQRREVLLSFTVSADSLVTYLKVLETPGDSFTAESFRLLREGPKWVPAVQDGKIIEEEVELIIVFK